MKTMTHRKHHTWIFFVVIICSFATSCTPSCVLPEFPYLNVMNEGSDYVYIKEWRVYIYPGGHTRVSYYKDEVINEEDLQEMLLRNDTITFEYADSIIQHIAVFNGSTYDFIPADNNILSTLSWTRKSGFKYEYTFRP